MKTWFSNYKLRVSNKVIYFLLALSLLGLADASYLTANQYMSGEVACSIVHGCEVVLTSKYATVYGIPLALGGVVYYASLFVLLYCALVSANDKFTKLFCIVAFVGFAVTLYLVYLQLFVIEAICQYCMISALLTTIIVITIIITWLKQPREIKNK